MNLDDDPPYPSSACYDVFDSDSNSDSPTRPSLSRFSLLKGSAWTLSLQRSGTSSKKKKSEACQPSSSQFK